MHNIHIGLVYAETGKDACYAVETEIESWGSENNWRTICGAVSQDNEKYEHEPGRFPVDEDCDTIEKINAMVEEWKTGGNFYGKDGKELFEKHLAGEKLTSHEWWQVKEYAVHMEGVATVPDEKFDVLKKHEFLEWKLDRCGVTNMAWREPDEGDKLWVVFIDMHS